MAKGASRFSARQRLWLGLGALAVVVAAACGAPETAARVAPQTPAPSGGAGANGATSGGGATGGSQATSSSTGGSATQSRTSATTPNLLVAFIGDQGNGKSADQVLELIKSEGAAATVHNGDFDYESNPNAWEDRVNGILGASYPYFAVIGNHDAPAWSGPGGYAEKVAARAARVPEMSCSGELGVKATCSFRGLRLVESCIGVGELRTSCMKDSAEQVSFIRSALASSDAIWSVCNWHKNQRDMQVGTKIDEVGWSAYKECMNAGALVATGHEHSYARTRTLTNVGMSLMAHGATGPMDVVTVSPGKTLVFVSGLGGASVRPFDHVLHDDDTWWASYYTSDAWFMNGAAQTGVGTHGALFVRFFVDGNPKKATAYFKDVTGRVADSFAIYAE